jgi:hypothetical protein
MRRSAGPQGAARLGFGLDSVPGPHGADFVTGEIGVAIFHPIGDSESGSEWLSHFHLHPEGVATPDLERTRTDREQRWKNQVVRTDVKSLVETVTRMPFVMSRPCRVEPPSVIGRA